MTSGFEALSEYAPAAGVALRAMDDAAVRCADSCDSPDLARLTSQVIASVHGLTPLIPGNQGGPAWPSGQAVESWPSWTTLTDADRVLLLFAEQFSTDVAALTDTSRTAFLAQFGRTSGDLSAMVFVMDFLPRIRVALDALFGPSPDWAAPHLGPRDDGPGIWDAFDLLIRSVPRLEHLDPVTTELVRLRIARQHNCRLCRSIRSRPALRAGADDQMFLAVDSYEASDLEPLAKAALALADALVWHPARLDQELLSRVQQVATGAQQVELILDVLRNSLNKVAVALGADAAHTEGGVEIFDIDADGDLVYGLSLD